MFVITDDGPKLPWELDESGDAPNTEKHLEIVSRSQISCGRAFSVCVCCMFCLKSFTYTALMCDHLPRLLL